MVLVTVLMLITASAAVGRCSIIVDTGIIPPQFAVAPTWPDRNYYDEDGPPISLSCKLKTMAGMTLLWYRDGTALEDGKTYIAMSDNNQTVTLVIPKQSQTGTYMCRALNQAGSVNHKGYIYIAARKQETRPRIVRTDPTGQVKHVAVGDNITVSCVFDVGGTDVALMDLTNNWLKNSTELQDNNHSTFGINVTKDKNQLFSLTLSNFKVEDYGEYVCYGENRLGNDSRTIFVARPIPNTVHLPMVPISVGSVGGVCLVGMVVMVTLFIRRKRQWNKYEELEWLEPDVSNFQVPDHNLEYDVFISYSSNDLKWVKDVLFDNLVANGYSVCIDFKDFTPGMAISENIIDAIYKSRHTIVLLSKNFLKSMWGQFELQQAHNRAVVLRNDLLILIKYDKSKVPATLMGKTFLDWSDKKVQPHFWQRLYEAIGEPADFATMNAQHPNEQQVNGCAKKDVGDVKDKNKVEENIDNELHDSGIAEEITDELLQARTARAGIVDEVVPQTNEINEAVQEVNDKEANGFKEDAAFLQPVRAKEEHGAMKETDDHDDNMVSLDCDVTHINLDVNCIIDVH